MKIDGTNTTIQIDAYMRQARQSQQEAVSQENIGAQAPKSDKVQISQTAVEAQKAVQLLKETPDVREDKVREIKLQIETGRYAVSTEKVADRMLKEGFENDLILKKIDTRA
jgi:negative regulator of flagellin synthesis FlgM